MGEMKRVYELDVYRLAEAFIRYGLARHSRDSFEETKSWLRKLIRRKILSESNAREYKAIVEKLDTKLKAFINSTKS